MRNYSVIASHMNDDFVWSVYEHSTEQVLETFFFEDDAIDSAEFMENGGAFAGFTPSFMLNRIEIPKEQLNETFQQTFSE